MALVALKFNIKSRVYRYGFIGSWIGIAMGFFAVFAIGVGHWFGWFDINLPVLTVGGAALSESIWLPIITCIAGMLIGAAVALTITKVE